MEWLALNKMMVCCMLCILLFTGCGTHEQQSLADEITSSVKNDNVPSSHENFESSEIEVEISDFASSQETVSSSMPPIEETRRTLSSVPLTSASGSMK